MLYIHECTNHLFGHFNDLTDDRTKLYAHSFLCALFKLKSVRREHGKTAVRPGKFVFNLNDFSKWLQYNKE